MTKLLLNFFYAQPVGHAIEALHYANGYRLGGAQVSVALNAATPAELADLCPWLDHAYAIEHPFLEAGSQPEALRHVPREWDWVVDDVRRIQDFQLELFPGMRGYYEASDAHLRAAGRIVAVHDGDPSAIWSLDGVHVDYVTQPTPPPADRR